MYEADERDRVLQVDDLPWPEGGAPGPLVFASEHTVWLAYYVAPGWRETAGDSGDRVALVRFRSPRAHFFGPPNDEAIDGHPLARRGLHWDGCFEVIDSSWIRRLERMNRVHPRHSPKRFEADRHFVITFHDSTFECIADAAEAELSEGNQRQRGATPQSAIARALGQDGSESA
jgi:hypothetical protein